MCRGEGPFWRSVSKAKQAAPAAAFARFLFAPALTCLLTIQHCRGSEASNQACLVSFEGALSRGFQCFGCRRPQTVCTLSSRSVRKLFFEAQDKGVLSRFVFPQSVFERARKGAPFLRRFSLNLSRAGVCFVAPGRRTLTRGSPSFQQFKVQCTSAKPATQACFLDSFGPTWADRIP